MSTQEIPRNVWTSFFDTFSRQHQGWLATLEIFATDVGAQQEVKELPFEGVSLGSETGEAEISISFGRTAEDHVSHTIKSPAHIWIEQTTSGANAALEIESEDQSKTLLRFRSPMPPEFVDGVVLD